MFVVQFVFIFGINTYSMKVKIFINLLFVYLLTTSLCFGKGLKDVEKSYHPTLTLLNNHFIIENLLEDDDTCAVLEVPFTEGFNTGSETLDCWTFLDVNNDGGFNWMGESGKWFNLLSEWDSYEGSGCASFSSDSWDNTENDDWLISPSFNLNGTYRLKYYYKINDSGAEYGLYMSNGGVEPESFTTELVASNVVNGTGGQYIAKTIIIEDIVGVINFGWHNTSNSQVDARMFVDLVTLEEVENCIEPLGLSYEGITDGSVTLNWDNDFGGTEWEFIVQELDGGLPNINGTETNSNQNNEVSETFDGTDLEPNTEYEFYVRTVCEDGSFSIWSGPISFTTLCAPIAVPFTEGFNTDSETLNCWTILDLNNDGQKFSYNNWNMYEGDDSIRYGNWSPNNHDDWLISPTFNGVGNYRVRYYYLSSSQDNAFSVHFSDSGIDVASFTEVIPATDMVKTPGGWKEKVFYIDDVAGEFNIAFYAGPNQSIESKDFNIDHFRIEAVPDCPEPYNVEITISTETSLDVIWDQYGDVDTWEVVILPAGTEFPADEDDLDIHLVEGNPTLTLEDLEPGTLYNVYVRAICDEITGENSIWSEPAIGGTLPTNDACLDAINVPVNPDKECVEFVSGTTIGATLSAGYETPDCMWNDPVNDVWFEFTATTTYIDLTLSNLFSANATNPSLNFAVYEGNECGALEEIYCGMTGWDDETYIRMQLEVDTKYYIRIMESFDPDVFFDLCLTSPLPPIRTSEYDVEYTVEELVKEVLVKASCDLVSNVTFTTGTDFMHDWMGGPEANGIGYFHKNGSDFEFEDGIILATNGVQYAPGPSGEDEGNDSEGWLGDDDLQQLLNDNGQNFDNHNASILEFDFIPVTDTIKFDFIFASNEYGPSFQCSFSDVFAFFLTDLETGNITNLAVVPGTDIPVSVTTIHDAAYQGDLECGNSYEEYFDKYYGDFGLPRRDNSINYDGMTVPMFAISAVKPGKKYHIKLAIADYSDSSVNSAVFLRGGSFDLGSVDFGEDMRVDVNTALCEGSTVTLDSGLNTDWVDIKWFKNDEEIVGETDAVLIVTEEGEYRVEGHYIAVPDCAVTDTILIEFYIPVAETLNKPVNIEYCRNSLDPTLDISVVEEDMFALVENKEDYTIAYYTSELDRENAENAVADPTVFPIPAGVAQTIYMYVYNELSGCSGNFEFVLVPVAATVPKNPGNQQACMEYILPELPKNQYYFSEPKGLGTEFKAGDVIDEIGVHDMYIYSISGSCFEEVYFTISITAQVEAFVLEDVNMSCANYFLKELPLGSKYYTGPSESGIELVAGSEIFLSQTIYIFTKSEEGPNHCTAESSFKVSYNDCPIPKGISPNGDGNNDRFDLSVHGVTSIKIFNRYGTEVFAYGMGYTDEWMGQDKSNNLLPDGTYYYVIISHGKVKTGWVQINK